MHTQASGSNKTWNGFHLPSQLLELVRVLEHSSSSIVKTYAWEGTVVSVVRAIQRRLASIAYHGSTSDPSALFCIWSSSVITAGLERRGRAFPGSSFCPSVQEYCRPFEQGDKSRWRNQQDADKFLLLDLREKKTIRHPPVDSYPRSDR
jgi:hypothetical protein